MSKRFFVDEELTADGKYRVLQEDEATKERFGVKDFDTLEEAQSTADHMQNADDMALSEDDTLMNMEIPVEDTLDESEFKDTLQDLKNETSQE